MDISTILFIFSFLPLFSICSSSNLVQDSIEELLLEEFDLFAIDNAHQVKQSSYATRRCYDYLACENPIPVIEMQNTVFWNGSVSLVQPSNGRDARSSGLFGVATAPPAPFVSRTDRISDEELSKLHGGSRGYLPPIMGHFGKGSYDLILGPLLQKETLPEGVCEGKWRNHSGFFHFPWEITNTFHSLNDNSLAVLTSVFLQAMLNPTTNTLTRNVYLFRDVLGHSSHSTLFYRLMYNMFGSSQVKSASDILTGGPHCIRHAVFGPPFKVYQKSSLFILRMKMYQLMKLIGKRIVNKPHIIGYDVSRKGEVSGNRQRPKESRRPRVVILTRNMTAPLQTANRKIATKTEQQLMRVFEEYGADVFICCDFRVINTVEKMIEVFWDVDICVSIHGAQFSNCIFGSPGLVVFEFGSSHGYGVDVYMKLAYMMMGNYILYDLRNADKKTDMPGPGAVLSLPILHDVVQLCLATWRYTVNVTLPRVEKKLHLISSSVEHKTLYREFNKQHHGYTAPSATSLLPQHMYPKNAMKVYHQLSSSEAIIRFDRSEVFVNRSRYQKDYEVFLKEYLIYDKNEGRERVGRGSKAANWAIREHEEHLLYKDIEKTHQSLHGNPDLLSFHKQRERKENFMKVAGVEPYSLPTNHREYMVFFHPFAFDDDDGSGRKGHRKEHVLGPHVGEDVYFYCTSLPNYKYRLMTQPLKEHRGECDLPIIHMKRSGSNDRLISEFLK